MGSSKNNSSQCFSRKVKWRYFGSVLAQSWRYFGVIFKKNDFIMVLSNDYRNDFTFQITCPSKLLTALRIFKIHYYTHNRDLLLSVGKCGIR